MLSPGGVFSADHPRIRGEHTGVWDLSDVSAGSSPHTRGAHLHARGWIPGDGIIPAYAGSTVPVSDSGAGEEDHPRIRGEHRLRLLGRLGSVGSSPHTRGARRSNTGHYRRMRIIPAYAGSTMAVSAIAFTFMDHPRIRGEHSGSPTRRPGLIWIIPAYAGSTHYPSYSPTTSADHPRIRGEHRASRHPCDSGTGSSPHTRGALLGSCGLRGRPRDHPRIRGEHAGWVSSVSRVTGSSPHTRGAPPGDDGRPCSRWDHPRIRGEHSNAALYGRSWSGSSPHTRGAQTPRNARPSRSGIIPAYAGSTRDRRRRHPSNPDHPRIRGEHVGEATGGHLGAGSSPHTRGAPSRAPSPSSSSRIIPAYAGSTARSPCTYPSMADHPRIRGEHLPPVPRKRARNGSSPHTRGARDLVDFGVVWTGIIPAYAGSTHPARRPRMGDGDHPRIRGEHSAYKIGTLKASGSSPHTRGARAR